MRPLAGISLIVFTLPNWPGKDHPTCAQGKILGPCFKTGRVSTVCFISPVPEGCTSLLRYLERPPINSVNVDDKEDKPLIIRQH